MYSSSNSKYKSRILELFANTRRPDTVDITIDGRTTGFGISETLDDGLMCVKCTSCSKVTWFLFVDNTLEDWQSAYAFAKFDL
ncbi:MAG: hypothetical protein E7510_09800 [Ruminococcus sp.]|nr:hypothetical protein [Ruminococcus sp.]